MRFSELKPGNIFRFYNDDIYMKTKTVHKTRGFSDITIAIRLKDMSLLYFGPNDIVKPIENTKED